MRAQDIVIIKKILWAQLDGVDVLSKYFLIRVAWSYGGGLVDGTLDDLEAQLELPRSRITRSRKALLSPRAASDSPAAYLIEKRVLGRAARGMGGARGRPRNGFQLDAGFLSQLDELDPAIASRAFQKTPHDQLIKHLLFAPTGSKRVASGGGKGKAPSRLGAGQALQAENRLLLALLWSLADDYGVVRNAGASFIARQAGMSRDQVNSQLKKLARLGYVRSRIAGVSGSGLFGRAEGVIYLDPLNADLPRSEDGRRRQWIAMSSNEGVLPEFNHSFHTAKSINRLARTVQHGGRDVLAGDEQNNVPGQSWMPDNSGLSGRVAKFEAQAFVTKEPASSHSTKEQSPNHPLMTLNLYKAFTGANEAVKMYSRMLVCRYATELLRSNARQLLGGCIDNVEVLASIQKEVCTKENASDQQFAMGLARWFYSWSRALALELLNRRAYQRKTDAQHIIELGTYEIVPLRQGGVAILANEPEAFPAPTPAADQPNHCLQAPSSNSMT